MASLWVASRDVAMGTMREGNTSTNRGRGESNASLEGFAGGTRSADQRVHQSAQAAGGPQRSERRVRRRPHGLQQDVLGALSERAAARAEGCDRGPGRGHRDQPGAPHHHVGARRARLEPLGDAARHDHGGDPDLAGAGRAQRAGRPAVGRRRTLARGRDASGVAGPAGVSPSVPPQPTATDVRDAAGGTGTPGVNSWGRRAGRRASGGVRPRGVRGGRLRPAARGPVRSRRRFRPARGAAADGDVPRRRAGRAGGGRRRAVRHRDRGRQEEGAGLPVAHRHQGGQASPGCEVQRREL